LIALGWAAACATKSEPRAVTVYTPNACPAQPTAQATYQATGDFSPPVEQVTSLASVGVSLAELPPAARSISVEAGSFEGVSLVDPTGPVDVLVLPYQQACHLTENVNPPLSEANPGATFGRIDMHHALVVGGASADAPSVIDLGTGAIASVSPSLVYPRNLASVTSFGAGALVAGGESPSGFSPMDPATFTAEVYQPAPGGGVGGFTQTPIFLKKTRTNHAAVSLATGETLLIGGSDGTSALSSIEYVSPGATTSVLLPLSLSTPRVGPTVFRLPTGKIFVGGGFGDDGSSLPSVEWLDADSEDLLDGTSSKIPPLSLCMQAPTAFAPLEGGAVLVVLGATPQPNCSNVLVIRPDFTVDQALPLSPPPSMPMLLFSGARSAPVLLTASAVSRWDPWAGSFVLLPGAVPTESPPTAAFFSPDPGLAVWLGSDAHVWGLRFDLRDVYSTDATPDLSMTKETAPDRLLPSPDIQFQSDLGLTLRSGASVFVTDVTFADATIDFTAAEGPFRLILRDNDTGLEFEVGQEGSCFQESVPMDTPIRVVREGATLGAGISASASNTTPLESCAVPEWLETARVAVGFRGPSNGTNRVSSVSVQRTGSPN
jgi:hypothetical protein